MGAAVRSAEKAVGGGGALTCRGAALCCSPAFMFGTKCPKHKSTEALCFRARLQLILTLTTFVQHFPQETVEVAN